MCLYLKEGIQFTYKLIWISLLLFLFGCQREELFEPIDSGLPPEIPANLFVFASYDGNVGIEWVPNTEFDLLEYRVYRSLNNNNFITIGSTTNNYFIDDSLEYNLTYYYKISAVNKSQLESQLSNSVFANPKNIYKPLAPTFMKINARNWPDQRGIKLSWKPSAETDIIGYNIYRNTISSFTADTTNFIAFSKVPFYFDKDEVITQKSYSYIVKTVDKALWKSNPSTIVSDIILDKPILLLPANNAVIKQISEVKIKTISIPASYKVIFKKESSEVIKEISFETDKVNYDFTIPINNINLELNKTYKWQVITFSNSDEPNSISEEFLFTYNPN